MNKNRGIIYAAVAVLWLFACQATDERIDLKPFYFPYAEMEDGLVYIYETLEGLPYAYDTWFYKYVPEGGKDFLTAQQYDIDGNVIQFQLQELSTSGALLDQNIFYRTDSSGRAIANPCEILEDSHYPFYAKDSLSIFVSGMRFVDPRDSTIVTLIRNRRFLKDTIFAFDGKSVPAILLEVKEAYDYDKEGILSVESKGREIYAKDLGLVYSRKVIQDSFAIAYRLDRVLSMDAFLEQRAGE